MSVTLRPVTRDNWQQAISLKVAPEQKEFVASNLYSVAQAWFDKLEPMAIYRDDAMVGFAMYGPDPDLPPERHGMLIYRLMIDAAHQGRGYGRKAMELVLDHLRAMPECHEIFLGVAPGNVAAERLYRSLGFIDSDITWPGETVLRLVVR